MFDLSAILFALDMLTKAFKVAKGEADLYANEDYQRLGEALESLHFGENGVLPILRTLAEGREIPEDAVERIYGFQPTDPDVSEALARVMDAVADREKLSLANREKLRALSKAKTGIRWNISRFAEKELHSKGIAKRKDIARLVSRIEKFNEAIEEFEQKLRQRKAIQ